MVDSTAGSEMWESELVSVWLSELPSGRGSASHCKKKVMVETKMRTIVVRSLKTPRLAQ
jgi:hypothetical protein